MHQDSKTDKGASVNRITRLVVEENDLGLDKGEERYYEEFTAKMRLEFLKKVVYGNALKKPEWQEREDELMELINSKLYIEKHESGSILFWGKPKENKDD